MLRKVAKKLLRAFGRLPVRQKLIVLHNGYFLVLAAAIYWAVVPWLSQELSRLELQHLPLIEQLRWRLAVTLVSAYVLAVAILEGFVMPFYIYRPLRAMLVADEAARKGDTENELVSDEWIQPDELGQLVASRNATLQALRERERQICSALAQLQATTADLERKTQMLEAARQRLIQQERLASLGLLSASIAHELNTPLAVLHGSIEQLLESPQSPETRARLVRLLRATERLRSISETLLGFARGAQQPWQLVPLRQVVEAAWELAALDEKAQAVRFRNDCPPDLNVHGSRDRLCQLMLNLLANAVRVSPVGGEVRVSAWQEASGQIHVAVDDQGPGVPESVRNALFEGFIVSRLDAQGTGLGLAIAQGIVDEHGGSIRVTHGPDGGARIVILLPPPPHPADQGVTA